jgi:hypothetical protein
MEINLDKPKYMNNVYIKITGMWHSQMVIHPNAIAHNGVSPLVWVQ